MVNYNVINLQKIEVWASSDQKSLYIIGEIHSLNIICYCLLLSLEYSCAEYIIIMITAETVAILDEDMSSST